jgi:hypothetical protein
MNRRYLQDGLSQKSTIDIGIGKRLHSADHGPPAYPHLQVDSDSAQALSVGA